MTFKDLVLSDDGYSPSKQMKERYVMLNLCARMEETGEIYVFIFI